MNSLPITHYRRLNPDRASTEIMMFRTNPKFQSYSFLIVEGEYDLPMFNNIVDRAKCWVVYSGGRDAVIKSLENTDKTGIKGILAIVDSDYWILSGKSSPSINLLTTDYHDLETMLLESDALEKTIFHIYLYGKLHHYDKVPKFVSNLRTVLYEIGLVLGYLRWVSLNMNLPLGFSELDFTEFVDANKFQIDLRKLIIRAKNTSQRCQLSDVEIMQEVNKLIKANSYPVQHVCHGKDLIEILSIVLPFLVRNEFGKNFIQGIGKAKGKIITRRLESEKISRELRLAYEYKHFKSSNLYISIRNWEKNTIPFEILDASA